jgi:hypothetical protein
MKRLAPSVFAVLALATVGAFYLTQHLKVSDPLINGLPRADPAVINPLAGGFCVDLDKKYVSFRSTKVGFFLQRNNSRVVVHVLNGAGQRVADMRGSGRMLIAGFQRYYYFTWAGREYDGQLAPDGTYSLQAVLEFDGRAFPVGKVTVLTSRPTPTVDLTVDNRRATLRFTPAGYRSVMLEVYRQGERGKALAQIAVAASASSAVWNERFDGKRAPAGGYLIGLQVRNASCTFGGSPLQRVTIRRARRHHRH